MRPSSSRKIPYGAAKLCQDMATLINNRQGSDIQFIVGGASPVQENGASVYDNSATMTLYAHSVILRCRSKYFATMLDSDRHWMESSSGVIYKPNILPSTFQDILYYIYTGNVRTKDPKNIIELIVAADEMDLEDLIIQCKTELKRAFERIFSDEDDDDEDSTDEDEGEESTNPRISIDVAIRTHVIPALNLASNHSLSRSSQILFTIMLPHMSMITKSPDTYTTFINGVSSETLAKIIASDDLAMNERNVWDLVLSWGCHRVRLSKAAVEARLNISVPEDDEMEMDDYESSDEAGVSDLQLNQLKEILMPFLPAIRFSLLDPDDYYHLLGNLNYFLSHRRSTELGRFFVNPELMGQLDVPRKEFELSKIIKGLQLWNLLKEYIFKTGGIAECASLDHLKFKLLFRAREHDFLAKAFHQHCDLRGPTLVLVRSFDGHIFGGVNFNHWKSDYTWSSSHINFLFALPDGRHRNNPALFTIQDSAQAQHSSRNHPNGGPSFGSGRDLHIADSADTNNDSVSYFQSYTDGGEDEVALAGALRFVVSDYEVFAISK